MLTGTKLFPQQKRPCLSQQPWAGAVTQDGSKGKVTGLRGTFKNARNRCWSACISFPKKSL